MGAQDGSIAPLQFGNPVFQLQANAFEYLQILLLAMRLARVDQPVDPPMTAKQTIQIVFHRELRLRQMLAMPGTPIE